MSLNYLCSIIKYLENQDKMKAEIDLKQKTMSAAAEQGMNNILFRNALNKKLNLNATEGQCLSLLGIKGISSPTELAKQTGLTTGATTTMLDRLEKRGFITRKANPNDRRGTLIAINPGFGKEAGQYVMGVQKAHKELFATYSDKELETIIDFLTRFTQNVKTATEAIENQS